MSGVVGTLGFWFLAALALAGALAVLATRDVMRLIVGLGVTFLALAGLFGISGMGFLAIAELFLYVGGVLVVFLFAIMLAHRGKGGVPDLESRHGVWPALVAAGVFAVLVAGLAPFVPRGVPLPLTSQLTSLATALLGPMLPQFEAAGILLLAALAAVVALAGGERK